jgi:hypothetical protein
VTQLPTRDEFGQMVVKLANNNDRLFGSKEEDAQRLLDAYQAALDSVRMSAGYGVNVCVPPLDFASLTIWRNVVGSEALGARGPNWESGEILNNRTRDELADLPVSPSEIVRQVEKYTMQAVRAVLTPAAPQDVPLVVPPPKNDGASDGQNPAAIPADAVLPWRSWDMAKPVEEAKRDEWAREIISGVAVEINSGDSIVFISHGEMDDSEVYDCIVRRTLHLHGGKLVQLRSAKHDAPQNSLSGTAPRDER